ncbi:ATP-binding protein [Algoriphagus sp. A40]|uniref:ATP-binding protein n=1 Tax=Algoriphagus sp. A40 TaxID=1945863 RepID=UPI000987D1B0|nr:ATP-binding protein [Algoriphagus sp. A40]
MIKRDTYIDKLKKFIGKPQVKIITGIRRSGKSTVLRLLMDELTQGGVKQNHIIYLNFESFANSHLTHANNLYEDVKGRISGTEKYYLLFDEVQEVENWERAINSFLVDFNTDIYLTGSNSHLLSSELSTFLAGRYVEIPIFTLSFSEFLDFKRSYSEVGPNQIALFVEYLRKGGFPVIHTQSYDEETANQVVRDIYDSVILRDSVQRHKIRDIELLNRVIQYAFDNIGNTFSGKNVADYFNLNNVLEFVARAQNARKSVTLEITA